MNIENAFKMKHMPLPRLEGVLIFTLSTNSEI